MKESRRKRKIRKEQESRRKVPVILDKKAYIPETYFEICPPNGEVLSDVGEWGYRRFIRPLCVFVLVGSFSLLSPKWETESDRNIVPWVIFLVCFSIGMMSLCKFIVCYHSRVRWILKETGVTHIDIKGNERFIPYAEIKEMVKKKKITMHKGCLWVPYKGGKIPLQINGTEYSKHKAIPILNRKCHLEIPDMSEIRVREIVYQGGQGSVCLDTGIKVFLGFFLLYEMVDFLECGEIRLVWDREILWMHMMLDLWMIAIGIVKILLHYWDAKDYFERYDCIKVR